MKRITLLSLIFCGLLVSYQAFSQRRSKTVPDTARGAELTLAENTYNFGDVPRKGGDLVREFPFTNTGDAPLVVMRIETSCSCIKASFSKRPIAPGGSGVIRITYEPHKGQAGNFSKMVLIYSNSSSGRKSICVQGNSIDENMPRKIKTGKHRIKIK